MPERVDMSGTGCKFYKPGRLRAFIALIGDYPPNESISYADRGERNLTARARIAESSFTAAITFDLCSCASALNQELGVTGIQ